MPQNLFHCIVEILFKFLLLAFKMNYIDTYYFIYYVFVKEYLSLNVTLCKSFDETRPSSYSYFGTYFNSTSILKSFLCSRICKKCLHSLDDYNLALQIAIHNGVKVFFKVELKPKNPYNFTRYFQNCRPYFIKWKFLKCVVQIYWCIKIF